MLLCELQITSALSPMHRFTWNQLNGLEGKKLLQTAIGLTRVLYQERVKPKNAYR